MAKTQVRGEQILDQSVSLTADIKDTLAIANGGTGATSASAARTALGAQATLSPGTALVATSQSTTSTSYADLATTTDTVTVTIGASGSAVVNISANWTATGFIGYMGYAISGATTTAASDDRSVANTATTTVFTNFSGVFIETGLTPGSTTFKAKYKSSNGSGSQTFSNRRIAVIPL